MRFPILPEGGIKMRSKLSALGLSALGLVAVVTVGFGALGSAYSWRAVPDSEAAQLVGGQTCKLMSITACGDADPKVCRNLGCRKNDPKGKYNLVTVKTLTCGTDPVTCGVVFKAEDCVN
jgi:hypothetical protein